MNDVNSLIDNILNKEFTAAEAVVGEILGTRAGESVDQEKINVASSIFDTTEESDDNTDESDNEDV